MTSPTPATPPITADRLRSLLAYDQETGIFRWSVSRAAQVRAGDVAGSTDSGGYRQIMIDGRAILSHRLAWLYVYGEYPRGQIDHINGTRDDNRIANLRVVNASENAQNKYRPRSDNKLGLLGVHQHGKRFRAEISTPGKIHSLGVFATPEEAHRAYLDAKKTFHPAASGYVPYEYTPSGKAEAWVREKVMHMQGRKVEPKKDRSN